VDIVHVKIYFLFITRGSTNGVGERENKMFRPKIEKAA
jgi:hypothetical protein